MPTIMTKDLSRKSGQLVAVEKLSLTIDEVFGLLGPNDAGKTTTICILARLARAISRFPQFVYLIPTDCNNG